jgi:hypothetical protein
MSGRRGLRGVQVGSQSCREARGTHLMMKTLRASSMHVTTCDKCAQLASLVIPPELSLCLTLSYASNRACLIQAREHSTWPCQSMLLNAVQQPHNSIGNAIRYDGVSDKLTSRSQC